MVPTAARNVRILPGIVSGGDPHAYFSGLRSLPHHLRSWALRSQAELDAEVAQPPSKYFTYDPTRDPYPTRQDAAKLLTLPGRVTASVPIAQQLRMPVPKVTVPGSLLFTWDWYWGPEFLTLRGGMNHYKAFKFQIDGHSLWTLMHSPAWADAGEIGKIWDSITTHTGAPDGMVNREPWTPAGPGCPDQRKNSGQQVGIHANTWMRYWVEFKLFQPHTAFTDWNQITGATLRPNSADPQGRWHMISMWWADERRGPMRLLYRIPVAWKATWNAAIDRFDFEMNTSQSTGFIGPWTGYGRNVVILRDYPASESDTALFARPV